jgi:CRP/FNR family transcriptional regulator
MSSLAELVALYPLLGDVAADLRDAMEDQVATLTLPAGAVVFDERQACQGLPFVLGGSIRVVKAAANGRELQLYPVGPGETCIISSSCLLGHAGLQRPRCCRKRDDASLVAARLVRRPAR